MKWSQLAQLGRNRIVKSSYIWLVLVPLVAKATSTLGSEVWIGGLEQGIRISTELPFSWRLLYYSAVLAALGNVFFALRCPDINKLRGFGQFESLGLGVRYLRGVVRHNNLSSSISEESLAILQSYQTAQQTPGDYHDKVARSDLYTLFWDVYHRCSESKTWERRICVGLYASSLLLICAVFGENFMYVVYSR